MHIAVVFIEHQDVCFAVAIPIGGDDVIRLGRRIEDRCSECTVGARIDHDPNRIIRDNDQIRPAGAFHVCREQFPAAEVGRKRNRRSGCSKCTVSVPGKRLHRSGIARVHQAKMSTARIIQQYHPVDVHTLRSDRE